MSILVDNSRAFANQSDSGISGYPLGPWTLFHLRKTHSLASMGNDKTGLLTFGSAISNRLFRQTHYRIVKVGERLSAIGSNSRLRKLVLLSSTEFQTSRHLATIGSAKRIGVE